ncbi:MAG TPA: hypothetical protein VEL11_08815 [Candidatus Bathyarchaeia archaeon]|nr:hypothetical protein [Candidatus Bathyarchaeia archaeon]
MSTFDREALKNIFVRSLLIKVAVPTFDPEALKNIFVRSLLIKVAVSSLLPT